MMQYVINSTDNNLFYAYFIPIVSQMWKSLGYYPVTLVLGQEPEWAINTKTSFVLEHIRKHSAVVPIRRVVGIKDSTVVQISRIFASAHEFVDDDYLLTSDADMLPLDKNWFHQQNPSKQFHIFGADAYGRRRFPICYLGATAGIWRKLMKTQPIGIDATLRAALNPARDDWNYDESLITEKLLGSYLYPAHCQFIDRGWPEGRATRRLDRAAWNWQGQRDLVDCHSLRPGYLHCDALRTICEAYFPEHVQSIADYMVAFNSL